MSIESVMPSNHLILSCPLFLPPSLLASIKVISNESVLHIRWPKYWRFGFSISPSNEYSGLISFRIDWLNLLAVQGTQESSPTPQFKSINSSALSFLYSPALTSIHDCWKRHLRVPWTAKRSKQSILREINPECSLEGLMLKLQYFGHLMQSTDSLEKTLMLGKIVGRK